MTSIVYVVYIGAAAALISCMVRNFLDIKSGKQDTQLSKQNFFAALIIFLILIGSFIVLLLRSKGISVSEGTEGGSLFGKLIGENSYFFRYIILFILAIIAIGLCDWFFLKRTAKNEQDYRRRRRFFFGILIVIAGTIVLMKLIIK